MQYWINQAETTNKMIYFFRFEDVLKDPEYELRNLFKFVLGMESLDGTVIEKRIKDTLALGAKKNQKCQER